MNNPKTLKDLSSALQAALSKDAAEARKGFINRNPKSGYGEKYHKKQVAKQFLVKGRAQGGGRVLWDVFELDGFSDPKVVGANFAWQEEAIAFARDRSLGRISMGYGKLRGVFRVGAGGVLSGDRTIELPGKSTVRVQQTKDGVVVG